MTVYVGSDFAYCSKVLKLNGFCASDCMLF